ncbi:NADH:flavin oxidoreductase/NADH oxidase [Aeromicrobium panaciterrae]|uniref:NADH:flavin oxidoreductase/NADH oxidase n=1 Tax=Aeromicrobium panaciterrae TaxID=363861 RepID=UPI0031D16CE7
MSLLFEPLKLRGVTARNRIWLAPMCQYSCFDQDGIPTDWHLVNLGQHAIGGFGIVLTEATAVVPEGRISPEDTGIWSDAHIEPWRRIAEFVRSQGALAGMQLAHAGRKGSTYAPFVDGDGTVPDIEGGWQAVGPSNNAFEGYAEARELKAEEVAALPQAFADAATRADHAGFDLVEIHAAHGYLLHEFLSPLVNHRTDQWGGSFDNRTRIVIEVVDAVRGVWPDDKPLFVRLSATDWADGGWDVEQTTRLAGILKDHGVDVIDVSSGGAVAEQQIVAGPGYQVPFAHEVSSAGVAVATVGLITEPAQAEAILADGSADAVMLGRAAIREPAWPLRAAHELGVPPRDAPYPPQHIRGSWR